MIAEHGMYPSTTTWVIDSESVGRELLETLRANLRTRRVGPDRRRADYYDTFDWRLYAAGGVLSASDDRGAWLLSWESKDGRFRQRLRVEDLPGFARDLPEGAFREALAPLVEMRRLLPVVRVETRGEALHILDGNDKTVATVRLERMAAAESGSDGPSRPASTTIRLLPVRGYDGARDQVTRLIEDHSGLKRAEEGPLGLALAALGREPGSYSSKIRLNLDPTMRADEAVRRVHRSLLDTILINEDGTRRDLDSEFLHDFRVAVRRTRSCLGQIKDVFESETIETFREEFAWLGEITGPTRDLDVYLLKMPEYEATLPEAARPDLAPLREFLLRHQKQAQRRLARELSSARYRRLIRRWREFLEREVSDRATPANAARPIVEVAREQIGRCHGRVLRQGRDIGPDSPARKLHRLRIACKKLRYLLEFFHSLFDSEDVAPLVKALRRLQDNLGEFNDLQVQQESLRRFASQMTDEGRATPETLIAMGRLVERLELRQAGERKRFAKRFARFADRGNLQRARRMLATEER